MMTTLRIEFRITMTVQTDFFPESEDPARRRFMLRDGEPGSMVKRMTVYVGNWGGESIPFDDAIPFSLT